MIKYGILQEQVNELVKLGMAEAEALEVVSGGRGEQMIKAAQAKKENEDGGRLEQTDQGTTEGPRGECYDN